MLIINAWARNENVIYWKEFDSYGVIRVLE